MSVDFKTTALFNQNFKTVGEEWLHDTTRQPQRYWVGAFMGGGALLGVGQVVVEGF